MQTSRRGGAPPGRHAHEVSGTRRAAWAIANEAIDSASNLFLAVWIARAVTPSDFGAFGLVYVGVLIGLVLARSCASMPMLIKFGASPRRFETDLAGRVLGVSMLVGLATSVISCVIALLITSELRDNALAAAAVAPGILLQDTCVYIFYARQRPSAALLNNAVWAITQLTLFLVATYVFGADRAWVYLGLWGFAAYLAVGVSLVQLQTLPLVHKAMTWLREYRSTITDLSLEMLLGQASQQGIVWVLGLVVSLTAVAGFRAAQVPLGVLRVFIQGLAPMGVTEGVRLYRRNPRLLLGLSMVWGTAGIALTGVVGVVLLLMPTYIGSALFGASWDYATPILLPMTIGLAASSAVTPSQAGLRSIDATRTAVKLRAPLATLQLGGVLLGATYAGLAGAAWGYALANCLGAVLAVTVYIRALSVSSRDTWPNVESASLGTQTDV